MHKEVIEYVKSQIANYERVSQPFRDRFAHTMRVYKWAERLHALEGGNLRVVQLASLFHDAGWDENTPHELVSAELARSYLTGQGYPEEETEKVVEAVALHNRRKQPADKLTLETLIVMDADILDELGAITVLWDSMATALEDKPGYQKVYERMCRYLGGNKERIALVKTDSGKNFYAERISFIEHFLENLKYELGLSDEISWKRVSWPACNK